ncbi:hypothetical protein NDA03_25815 [Trichocoleus sp. Lan]|uniref:hypothetical protein n=1 Tax=Trichocoleus sp. Lan TaxID=2933927 RepID=UPI003298DC31
MHQTNNFPQPKFELGSTVLWSQSDPVTHVPHVQERQVIGALFCPQIEGFQCLGWGYLLGGGEDDSCQKLVPQTELFEPVEWQDLQTALGAIAAQFEVLLVSTDFWGSFWKNELYEQLPGLLTEAQDCTLKILRRLQSKDHSTSPD